MTADTRPVAQEAALDRLRKVLRPGAVIYVTASWSRSGDTCAVMLHAVREDRTLCRLNYQVARALGLFNRRGTEALVFGGDFVIEAFSDRLSVALFGEPGQIKGEYL